MPGVEVDDGAVVVAEVTQQPPEALRSAEGSVRDDEDAGTDARRSGGACEVGRVRQGVTATCAGRRREVGVDVQEARTRNVPGEVELATALGPPELPATVDELVAQTYQFPPLDGGNGTEAG